jgi:hypothetical protein
MLTKVRDLVLKTTILIKGLVQCKKKEAVFFLTASHCKTILIDTAIYISLRKIKYLWKFEKPLINKCGI